LSLAGGALLASLGLAATDLRRQDYLLESEIVRSQQLALDAAEVYQRWRQGGDSATTRKSLEESLRRLTEMQRLIEKRTDAAQLGRMRNWARHQRREVKFLLDDVNSPPSQRRTLSDLQQRWRGSVQMQSELIQARQARIPKLMGSACPAGALAYYQWKASLLKVLQAELLLCEELATALEASQAAPHLEEKALGLYGRVCRIRPPKSCLVAHQRYQERFTALKRLCESAHSLSDPDLIENLKYSEGEYRKAALACERASVQALGQVLGPG
jgi:hypothetical protein